MTTTSANSAKQVRQRAQELPAFLEQGSAAVDQTLERLVKAGTIERVARGVFVRPERSTHVGKVIPEPLKVAETIARSTGDRVQIHGAEAARRVEFTAQVPAQPIVYTSGKSKRFHLGKLDIRTQHVAPRELALAGRPAGVWQRGSDASHDRENPPQAARRRIRAKIAATNAMPARISRALSQYAQAEVKAKGSLNWRSMEFIAISKPFSDFRRRPAVTPPASASTEKQSIRDLCFKRNRKRNLQSLLGE